MEFEELKTHELYYAVTEGQFIGIFFCLKINKNNAAFFCSFYAGGKPVIRHIYRESFNWPFEGENDDDIPEESWPADMMPVKYYRNNADFYEHYEDMISALFEYLNEEIKKFLG